MAKRKPGRKPGPKPVPPERKRGELVRSSVTAEERELIEKAAAIRGVSVSEYIHDLIVPAARALVGDL